ncbi:MAG: glycosyltransferase family 39 protein [Acidobacteria bacterium]|nr:glycosyltransferase family 39 protein [Acidobacteriota bacterium]MBI3661909.1 glycosyltransferase family 39 protein [Acidobacteriota bacterium]
MNNRLHWLVLLVVGLIISVGITEGEFHFFGDEMRHAMTGVFFRDLIVDHPWSHPIQYVYEYYAKYPSLGLLYWPPLFHFIEGLFFLVFGISVVTSRLTILSFALLGVYFWYKIAEREGPRRRALASAFIFPLLPFVLVYERVTMLEVPKVALCLAAVYFWQSFMREERARDLWWFAAFLVATFLTSQKAVFLPFFVVLHFLVERRWRLLKRWDVWVAGLLTVVTVVPWYLFMLHKLSLSYERVAGQGFEHAATYAHLFYYLGHVTPQMGILLGVPGMAGFVWALLRARREHRFFLIWVVACYVCYTLIQEKSIRHSMIWIPVLVYFALVALENLLPRRNWVIAAFCVLAAYSAVKAVRIEAPKVSGIEPIAQYLVAQPDSEVLYYQGFLNGDFIFFVRKYDPEKRRLIAREKQIVATKVNVGYGTRRIMNTPEEVIAMFQKWGIRYAVVENREFIDGLGPVWVALQSDQFEVLRTYNIKSNNRSFNDRRATVYRFKGELRRSDATVTLPMMTLREDIKADLNRLAGRPWPN